LTEPAKCATVRACFFCAAGWLPAVTGGAAAGGFPPATWRKESSVVG